ncbi:hypothetical protein KKI24_29495 [bacterium]|nr:hypothetical protein [bacterium]
METIIKYLIPLLFILFFLSYRAKRKQVGLKNRPPGKPETVGFSLTGRLNKLLRDYYASDLKGAPAGRRTRSPWNQVNDPMALAGDYPEREPEKVQEGSGDDVPEPETVTPALPKPIPVPMAKTASEKRRQRPEKSAPDGSNRIHPQGIPTRLNQAELRKAVVWSEILAPPLALRDKNL